MEFYSRKRCNHQVLRPFTVCDPQVCGRQEGAPIPDKPESRPQFLQYIDARLCSGLLIPFVLCRLQLLPQQLERLLCPPPMLVLRFDPRPGQNISSHRCFGRREAVLIFAFDPARVIDPCPGCEKSLVACSLSVQDIARMMDPCLG